MEIDRTLLDRTIMDDYNKLSPQAQTDIAKKRPKIKQLILAVRATKLLYKFAYNFV